MSTNEKMRVFVAGHHGMVGSAICRLLQDNLQIELVTRARNELDLCDQSAVIDFFKQGKIDQVYLAAAKVGGINANNKFKADFIYNNLVIQNNIIHASFVNKIKSLIFLGSSCV